MDNDTREALAAYAHEAWSGWMRYLWSKATANEDGTLTLPVWAVERWARQMGTPYAELPEGEKASDRAEADQMLAIVGAPGVREALLSACIVLLVHVRECNAQDPDILGQCPAGHPNECGRCYDVRMARAAIAKARGAA